MNKAAATNTGSTYSRAIFWPISLPEKVGTLLTISSAMPSV